MFLDHTTLGFCLPTKACESISYVTSTEGGVSVFEGSSHVLIW